MIEDLIKEITKEVKNKYPQVEVPGAMKAKIISVQKTEDTYIQNVFLTLAEGETAGSTFWKFRYMYILLRYWITLEMF